MIEDKTSARIVQPMSDVPRIELFVRERTDG